jgi:hypothetical protein
MGKLLHAHDVLLSFLLQNAIPQHSIPAHVIDNLRSSAQICLRLNLNPHLLEQALDLHDRQKRAMLLKPLPSLQVSYQMIKVRIQCFRNVYAQLVHLFESSSSCLLQRMIYVVESAIYLFA